MVGAGSVQLGPKNSAQGHTPVARRQCSLAATLRRQVETAVLCRQGPLPHVLSILHAPNVPTCLQTRGILTWINDATPGCHHSDVQYTTVAGEPTASLSCCTARLPATSWTWVRPAEPPAAALLAGSILMHPLRSPPTPCHTAPQAASSRAPRCWAPAAGSSAWWVLATSRSAARPRPGETAWCRCPQVRREQGSWTAVLQRCVCVGKPEAHWRQDTCASASCWRLSLAPAPFFFMQRTWRARSRSPLRVATTRRWVRRMGGRWRACSSAATTARRRRWRRWRQGRGASRGCGTAATRSWTSGCMRWGEIRGGRRWAEGSTVSCIDLIHRFRQNCTFCCIQCHRTRCKCAVSGEDGASGQDAAAGRMRRSGRQGRAPMIPPPPDSCALSEGPPKLHSTSAGACAPPTAFPRAVPHVGRLWAF